MWLIWIHAQKGERDEIRSEKKLFLINFHCQKNFKHTWNCQFQFLTNVNKTNNKTRRAHERNERRQTRNLHIKYGNVWTKTLCHGRLNEKIGKTSFLEFFSRSFTSIHSDIHLPHILRSSYSQLTSRKEWVES